MIFLLLGLAANMARGFPPAREIGCNENMIANEALAGVPLTIQLTPNKMLAGTRFKLAFVVGSAAAPVSELFGVAFELHHTPSRYVRPVAPVQIQSGPFLQPNTYDFIRHEAANSVFYLAISRKRGAPGQSGFGELFSLSLEITADTPPGTEICFWLANIAANDSSGRAIALAAGPSVCLVVEELAIEVIPNPFTPNGDGSNDEVEFKREGGIPKDWVIRIMDRAGRSIRVLTGGANLWDGRDEQHRPVAPGAYLYTISDRKQLVKRGVIALVR